MIEVRDLRKSYGEFEAVRGVSFDAGPGGVVGILGPNGAGKTTILRILAGYHGPTSGTARVAGIDAAEDSRELKRRVGYLPENAPLYPELTAEEHLAFAAEARGLRGPAKAGHLEPRGLDGLRSGDRDGHLGADHGADVAGRIGLVLGGLARVVGVFIVKVDARDGRALDDVDGVGAGLAVAGADAIAHG
ncbi:MAG TPA: ATP-binding cassette domain-containing protein, partial [Spirochaetia bacterium]|nr:ATP-binding cassette domain-containing protein [Spirochaetia bacterium]